jgi:hypothetical protein
LRSFPVPHFFAMAGKLIAMIHLIVKIFKDGKSRSIDKPLFAIRDRHMSASLLKTIILTLALRRA